MHAAHPKNQWYAMQCQASKERMTATVLNTLDNLIVYLPEVQQATSEPARSIALFPGYLFVQTSMDTLERGRIETMPGVVRLITSGDVPVPVPSSVISAIRQYIADINQQGGLVAHAFRPGDAVRITRGPLCGLEALFQGPTTPSARVQILLELMGQFSRVEIDRQLLEPVSHHTNPQPNMSQRRSRGRGRPIRTVRSANQ
ncbi:MAG: hypothetical protein HC837_01620 [Chloroflexaceae bacterium]|nr:hypothetical protein [Chloroflexaceae bacterium]